MNNDEKNEQKSWFDKIPDMDPDWSRDWNIYSLKIRKMINLILSGLLYFVIFYVIIAGILTVLSNIYFLSALFAFFYAVLLAERRHHAGKKYR